MIQILYPKPGEVSRMGGLQLLEVAADTEAEIAALTSRIDDGVQVFIAAPGSIAHTPDHSSDWEFSPAGTWVKRGGGTPVTTVILPETALMKMEENDTPLFMLMTQPAAPLLNGNIYEVGYNGTVYECVAVDMGLMEDGVANGQILLGNLSGLGLPPGCPGSNDSAPFACVLSHTPVYDGDQGVGYGMCYPFDGATSVNLSVVGKAGETGDAGYTDKTVILTLDPLNGVAPTIDMVWSLAAAGKQVILHTVNSNGSGAFLPLVEYLENGGERYAYFVCVDHEDTIFRWTLGPNGFSMYTKRL